MASNASFNLFLTIAILPSSFSPLVSNFVIIKSSIISLSPSCSFSGHLGLYNLPFFPPTSLFNSCSMKPHVQKVCNNCILIQSWSKPPHSSSFQSIRSSSFFSKTTFLSCKYISVIYVDLSLYYFYSFSILFLFSPAFICMFIRHENFANYATHPRLLLWNNIALFLGFFSAFGLCIVANFQVKQQIFFT